MYLILVFKTTVNKQSDIYSLFTPLNEITGDGKWNFDLEDCDKILRVECEKNLSDDIIRILNNKGFICTELED
jgi:hypothetical protein